MPRASAPRRRDLPPLGCFGVAGVNFADTAATSQRSWAVHIGMERISHLRLKIVPFVTPERAASMSALVMSAMCQKQTFAALFDHLVSADEKGLRNG